MKFVFIDETENSTHVPGFYAVCAVAVDATKYKSMRRAIDKSLDKCGWSRDYEFKGSLIFSASKGDPAVTTEQRVDAASSMVAATVSKANTRAVSAIAWVDTGGSTETHLDLIAQAVARCLKTRPGGAAGKDVVIVFTDNKDGIKRSALSAAVATAVESRGYTLAEDIIVVTSSCAWPGVLLADVLAYLGMWTYAEHKLAGHQLSFFDDGVAPSQAVLKKMGTVQEMLESGSELQFLPKLG